VISEYARYPEQAFSGQGLVELLNASPDAVNLRGWQLAFGNSNFVPASVAVAITPVVLQPGQRWLIEPGSSPDQPDQTTGSCSGCFPDDGSLEVLAADGSPADEFGATGGFSTLFKEGAPFQSPGLYDPSHNFSRKPGSISTTARDTDDNAIDCTFAKAYPRNPNDPAPTALTAVLSFGGTSTIGPAKRGTCCACVSADAVG
jgi:hypothetical protein